MDHLVTYFGPKERLSKQKRYISLYNENPFKITTKQYMGLVHDLNSRMAHMSLLFDKNQQLDESELVDSLSNKALRSHKSMLISQGFNPETVYLATLVEHWKRSETTDNITMDKFSASYEDSDTKKHKNHSKKFKEREDNGKKRRKKNSSLYCSLHGEKNGHTSRDCKVPKKRLQIKTSLGMKKNVKITGLRNLISCRHNLPTKNPSMKI